uniref:Conotoxin Cl14.2b n=1 Tax=Californiconus californicus TaxID=1736779 RepID=CLE2B_CONCL
MNVTVMFLVLLLLTMPLTDGFNIRATNGGELFGPVQRDAGNVLDHGFQRRRECPPRCPTSHCNAGTC